MARRQQPKKQPAPRRTRTATPKQPKATTIEHVSYDNKSRKGEYLAIQEGFGPKRFYKWDSEIPYDLYLLHYRNQTAGAKGTTVAQLYKAYTGKRPGRKQAETAWKEYEAYRKKVQQKGTLSQHIKPGVTTATFNPHSMNAARVRKVYEQLLGPLVLDQELLDLVIKNATKMRHRFHFRTAISGPEHQREEVRKLADITDLGHRTVEEYLVAYLTDDMHLIIKGQQVDSSWAKRAARHLNLPDRDVAQYTNGTIRTALCHVTFARGRG